MRSIRSRLYVGYAALIFLLTLTLLSTLRATYIVQQHFNAAVHVDSTLSGDVGIRLLATHDQRQAVQEYLLLGEADDLARYHQLVHQLAQAQRKTLADGRMSPGLLPLFADLTRDEQSWMQWADQTVAHASRHESQGWVHDAMAHGEVLAQRNDAKAFPLFDTLARQQQRDLSNGLQALTVMKALLCVILVIAILLVGGVGWLMIRAVSGPVSSLARCAEAIGSGDMTAEVAVRGASEFQVLARSMETMRAQLLRDVTEQKSFEEQLTYQALHDALTDLPNRTLLHDRLDHALAGSRRSADPLALMVMDLDRFKEVNDSLGHAAGDQLLQEVARRLVAAVRTSDTVARLGGDEFSLILPDSGSQQAERTAQRVLQALRRPILVQDHQIYVDASIGIALFPEHGQSTETLLRHADVAMYAAKRAHKGISLYTPDHDLNSPDHLALISRLRDAIEQEKIVLHYQPIVSPAIGRVERVEALARWRPEGEDFIPPGQFIPVAEETGLIEPLTLLVLRQALAQCAAWRQEGLELGVAVNLSVSSMLNASLPDTIASALRRFGLDGSALMLEVTETALMTEPEGASEVLQRLHRLGIRIAIDDFGTGYSSLSYLQRLPIDEIKIDRSFIQHMGESEQVIVRSVIDLGRNLNLEVTAEGVEDEETWTMLRAMKCATVQGYYLSRPLPAGKVASWIQSYTRQAHLRDRCLTVIRTEHTLERAAGG